MPKSCPFSSGACAVCSICMSPNMEFVEAAALQGQDTAGCSCCHRSYLEASALLDCTVHQPGVQLHQDNSQQACRAAREGFQCELDWWSPGGSGFKVYPCRATKASKPVLPTTGCNWPPPANAVKAKRMVGACLRGQHESPISRTGASTGARLWELCTVGSLTAHHLGYFSI